MKRLNYLIGLIVSAVFIGLFINKINPGELFEALKEANFGYVLPLMLVNIVSLYFRSLRWKYLLSPIKNIPQRRLFPVAVIGFMANILFPARSGELVRAYIIGKKEEINPSSSVATIVVERLFDGFMVILLFSLILLFFLSPQKGGGGIPWKGIRVAGYFFIFFCAGLLFLLLELKRKSSTVMNLSVRILSSFPSNIAQKIIHLLESFSKGLAVLNSGKNILMISLSSLVIWGIYVLITYFLFFAMHIPLSLMAAVFIQLVLAFGLSLPSAPAFVGTFHWACALGLIYLGVPRGYAQSYSILLWFIEIFPAVFLGFIFLWKEGFTLRKIRTANVKGDSSDNFS